ncbi:SDR family oxidoreductase [Leifsonia poae]|uniref:SDR family oxidoreductase n=1 Tax=Leifsonia poae TaxID=110933 RepID=UPI003D6761CC
MTDSTNETRPTGVGSGQAGALAGQIVVVIGGTMGIGYETARSARAAGADVIVTGRDPDRVQKAGSELGAISTAAFDATDDERLADFFRGLPKQVDHVMVTAGGSYYAPLAEMDLEKVRRSFDEHFVLTINVARAAITAVRPGGSLIFISGTAARHPVVGLSIAGFFSVGLPALTADLALELAPIRVNLLGAGFVDTPLSASLLGDGLDARRAELARTLPIRRVVQPQDVAALAVHLMTNTALTGGTYDVDGGQQLLVER